MAYTHAQIKKNIKYNENLIRSYQNSIKTLNNQIGELKTLKSKLQSYQTDFKNIESRRKNKIVNGFGNKLGFKFLSSYINGMKSIVTGSDFYKAYNSISSGMTSVDKQIARLRSEISGYNDKITAKKKSVSYWKNQLKYAKE